MFHGSAPLEVSLGPFSLNLNQPIRFLNISRMTGVAECIRLFIRSKSANCLGILL